MSSQSLTPVGAATVPQFKDQITKALGDQGVNTSAVTESEYILMSSLDLF